MTEEEYTTIDLNYITDKINNNISIKEQKKALEALVKILNKTLLYYDLDESTTVGESNIKKYPCKLLNIDIFNSNNPTIFFIKPCFNENDCNNFASQNNSIRVDKIYIKKTNDVAPVDDHVDDTDTDDDNEFTKQNTTTGGKPKSRRSNKKKSNKKKKTNKKRSTKRKSNKKKRKTHRCRR